MAGGSSPVGCFFAPRASCERSSTQLWSTGCSRCRSGRVKLPQITCSFAPLEALDTRGPEPDNRRGRTYVHVLSSRYPRRATMWVGREPGWNIGWIAWNNRTVGRSTCHVEITISQASPNPASSMRDLQKNFSTLDGREIFIEPPAAERSPRDLTDPEALEPWLAISTRQNVGSN